MAKKSFDISVKGMKLKDEDLSFEEGVYRIAGSNIQIPALVHETNVLGTILKSGGDIEQYRLLEVMILLPRDVTFSMLPEVTPGKDLFQFTGPMILKYMWDPYNQLVASTCGPEEMEVHSWNTVKTIISDPTWLHTQNPLVYPPFPGWVASQSNPEVFVESIVAREREIASN